MAEVVGAELRLEAVAVVCAFGDRHDPGVVHEDVERIELLASRRRRHGLAHRGEATEVQGTDLGRRSGGLAFTDSSAAAALVAFRHAIRPGPPLGGQRLGRAEGRVRCWPR